MTDAGAVTEESIRRVAFFDRLSDNAPKSQSLRWGELVALLRVHDVRGPKDGRLFSLTDYRNGATRGNDGVVRLTGFAGDVDDGWALDEAETVLRRGGWTYILYTTHSHTVEKPKYRIVIPFAAPVPSADWERVWAQFNELFGGHLDQGTKDPARLSFLPSHPPGAPSEVRTGEGRPLDVASLPLLIDIEQVCGKLERLPLGAETAEIARRLHDGRITTDGWPGDANDWFVQQLSDAGLSAQEIERFHRHKEAARHTSNWADRAKRIARKGADGKPKKSFRLRRETLEKSPFFRVIAEEVRKRRPVRPPPTGEEQLARQVRGTASPLFDEKGKPNRAAFVDALMRRYRFAALTDSRELLAYRDGVYDGRATALIESEIEREFCEGGDASSSYLRSEVEGAIRARSYVEREAFNPAGLLNLSNGVLDLRSLALLPHDPDRRFTYKLPVSYDSKATCPTWDKFLLRVLPDDGPRELALEAMGYTLTPTNPHQVAFILVGEGLNGKSTFLGVIRLLLGDANVAAETLQRLTDGRFSPAELWGKIANLAADIPDATVRHTGAFKMLTGGDMISAEKKHRDPFDFVWGGKAFFSCNKLPEVDDDTLAFWRRWIVFSFPVRITDEEKDPELLEKLKGELPGILNRALEALRRLEARRRFDVPATVASVREEWARRSNSLRWFLSERCQRSPTAWVTKPDLMVAYAEFCAEQGLVAKDVRDVGTQIGRWMPGVRAGRHHVAGRLTKTWDGLELVLPQLTLDPAAPVPGVPSVPGGSPSRDARGKYSTRENDPTHSVHPYTEPDPDDPLGLNEQPTRADRARERLERGGEG